MSWRWFLMNRWGEMTLTPSKGKTSKFRIIVSACALHRLTANHISLLQWSIALQGIHQMRPCVLELNARALLCCCQRRTNVCWFKGRKEEIRDLPVAPTTTVDTVRNIPRVLLVTGFARHSSVPR